MDPAKILVARFLRDNNYTATLDAFLSEVELPASIVDRATADGEVTIETLLTEKAQFDRAVSFERLAVDDGADRSWTKCNIKCTPVDELASKGNVLAVSVSDTDTGTESGDDGRTLMVCTAAKELLLLDLASMTVRQRIVSGDGSPILSVAAFGRYLVTGGMSGRMTLIDSRDGETITSRKDHSKFVVHVATHHDADTMTCWLVTAGWDARICLYKIPVSDKRPSLGEPETILELESNPEALLFTRRPESSEPVLILTRRDSSLLYFYALRPLRLIGSQDLAPMSNSWVAFTPTAMAICPTDAGLIAIATSSTPHIKLLVVRLLLPPSETYPTEGVRSGQSREVRVKQDRELAAIIIQCTTMAPQTQYSTPTVVWRPEGTGVWVNGDDGIVRGIERATGKVVESLEGHEPGTKVRCLCPAVVEGRELLFSGGFDQRLILWRMETA